MSSEAEESVKKENKIPLYIAPEELLNLDNEEVANYVHRVQSLLKHKERKIKHLKILIKKLQDAQKPTADKANVLQADVVEDTKEPVVVVDNELDEISAVLNESADAENKIKNGEEEFANDAFSLVNEMRQAAALAKNLTDFVYEPTSGLYYDQKSGYYYNAEYGLYYDGNSGCYYSYNEEKKAYEFHSQVQVQPHQKSQSAELSDMEDQQIEFDEWGGVITDKTLLQQIKGEKQRVMEKDKAKRKKSKREKRNKHKRRKHKRHHHHEKEAQQEVEDGELSSSQSSDSHENDNQDKIQSTVEVPMFEKSNRFQAIAKKYPPCLRIIVKETQLQQLKTGSLNLITFKGGSLGREGNHDVIIPDTNVSKEHLKFLYNEKKCMYQCIDTGSRNGTLLNGKEISDHHNKKHSAAHTILHGSIIQIGSTKLLCHVHEGNTTCGLCEPGLLIESTVATSTTTVATNTLSHKEQLKVLQKRYGLETEKFENPSAIANYNDRAATRRWKVGSSTDKEKTQVASVNTEISSENKGFKMLSKLGWSKGETLGKTNVNSGLLEPINVVQHDRKQGFGSEPTTSSFTTLSKAEKLKLENWNKTRERFQTLGKTADIFVESDESD